MEVSRLREAQAMMRKQSVRALGAQRARRALSEKLSPRSGAISPISDEDDDCDDDVEEEGDAARDGSVVLPQLR